MGAPQVFMARLIKPAACVPGWGHHTSGEWHGTTSAQTTSMKNKCRKKDDLVNCIVWIFLRLIKTWDVVRQCYIRRGTLTISRQRREKGGVSFDRKNFKREKMTTSTPILKYQLHNWYLWQIIQHHKKAHFNNFLFPEVAVSSLLMTVCITHNSSYNGKDNHMEVAVNLIRKVVIFLFFQLRHTRQFFCVLARKTVTHYLCVYNSPVCQYLSVYVRTLYNIWMTSYSKCCL